MQRHAAGFAVLLACSLGLALPSAAQETGGGTVEGNGMAVVERQPERMRLQIELLAKGKDLKTALEQLTQRRAAAEELLAELGAQMDSVKFGAPKLSTGQSDQQRQMEMMIRQQLRAQGKRATKSEATPPVSVGLSLSAEWPLEAGSDEELLIASHALQEKIRQADLAGVKAAEEALSPEEAELAEELQAAADEMSYGSEQQQPGEPTFLFVSRITDDEHQKALADAFEKARAEAGRLAKAASIELGGLKQLATAGEMGFDMQDYTAQYAYYYAAQGMRPPTATDGREALSPNPGPVKYTVGVKATFALKSP